MVFLSQHKPETNSYISSLLYNLEQEHNFRILFAIESGSRAWGMSSKDSDYDIRFVYVRPVKDYISLGKNKDVIDVNYNRVGESPKEGEETVYDIVGFDIHKYLGLLSKCKPTVIEWLHSPIIYTGSKPLGIINWLEWNFSPRTLFYHYQSMCRNNYLKYIQNDSNVTVKKYLYAFRGLYNAKWAENNRMIPPVDFERALMPFMNSDKPDVPQFLIEKIKLLLIQKQKGKEKDGISRIPKLDKYIEKFIETDWEGPRESKANTDALEKELRRIVLAGE